VAVVEILGLHDGYRGRSLFQGFDLTLAPGVTVILGPNGAGKTTLFKLICGLRTARGGSVLVLGQPPTLARQSRVPAQSFSYLPQQFGYLRSYTVAEFVSYVAWLQAVPKAVLAERVERALTSVDLAERRGDRMRSLSGGMVRRAGIAASLVKRPGLLILDEPTAGLDPVQRNDVQRVLAGLTPGTSTVMSTHLAEDAEQYATSVVILNSGRVTFAGSPAALLADASKRSGSAVNTVTAAYLVLMGGRRER